MATPEETEREFSDRMMTHRTLGIVGDIKMQTYADISARIFELQLHSNEPIKIMIDSRGGDIQAGMALYDLIKFVVTIPVHAIVLNQCDSAATFVLLACEKRIATPHATFLIHSGTLRTSLKFSEVSLINLDSLVADIRRNAEMLIDFYAKALNKNKDEVRKLIERGDGEYYSYLTASEAIEIGLITAIANENVGIFPAPQRTK